MRCHSQFRDDDIHMPSNKEQVILIANWLKKLSKTNELRQDYVKFMQDILQKGYTLRIYHLNLPCRKKARSGIYPIMECIMREKKHKIRAVFHCSAKFTQTSLNDKLLQGPYLTNSLVGVLTRFRQEPVAFLGNIEVMFHQVRVQVRVQCIETFFASNGGQMKTCHKTSQSIR